MSFQIVLCDSEEERKHLYPLVATRPIGNLRVGILTLDEKWGALLQTSVVFSTVAYLEHKYKPTDAPIQNKLYIKSSLLPTETLLEEIRKLRIGQTLVGGKGEWLATYSDIDTADKEAWHSYSNITFSAAYKELIYPEHIFLYNAEQISFDLKHCITCPIGSQLSASNVLLGNELYVEEGIHFEGVTLDARTGPIYIGRDVILETGVTIKGPAAICDGSRVKTGAVLYPNVTIGNKSTVCGEINNTVLWGNSAKGHEGYLGCAVLGEHVNMGAGTSNSNLKNNWTTVKLYDYSSSEYRDTGLLKCGVVIGDHSMLAIQSKITTGTVIGVGTQIAVSKFIPKFVPDFTWLTDTNKESYIFERFDKMMRAKALVKGEEYTLEDEKLLQHLYNNTNSLRIKQSQY